MCVFCAAIPATLAVGAKLQADQMRERREAEERGESPTEQRPVPAGKIALVAAGALVVASVIVHSQNSG
ncbi:MAG: hypothetical protein ACOYZ6_15300 [Chloroflexota bacterium]